MGIYGDKGKHMFDCGACSNCVDQIGTVAQDDERWLGQGNVCHTVPRCYGLTAQHFDDAELTPLAFRMTWSSATSLHCCVFCTGR